ncbi:MAG: class I SAM-dependent methyltransferase [Acidimicrobiia bacterium]
MDSAPEYRFYKDMAEWWPLISPPEEYAEESMFVGSLLHRASIPVRSVLELGSGGGHVASYLKQQFEMSLVDLSEQMLEVSRRLNPECTHLRGDMRTIRLNRLFDAVFVYDAIDYMITETDLAAAIETAFVHCRPGGVALFVPDHITENFEPITDHGGFDGGDGRGARYLEWTIDPDPTDSEIQTEYAFLLREADGTTVVEHETHRTGLFSRDTWLRLLTAAGFEPEVITEVPTEDRAPRELFLAHGPR